MRRRIGMDVTAAVMQGGGIGRYTRELAQALAQVGHEFELRFFTARPPAVLPVPNPLPTAPNIHLRRAPLDERWLYRLWYRLRLPLPVQTWTGRLDLFHSPDFVLPPVSGRIPTLVTVHDLSFVHYPETFTPALVRYLNDAVPRSVRRATHVLADSQATQADLVNLWQIDPGKITVLYSGVNPSFRPVTEREQMAALRARHYLDDGPYILSVSTIQPRKNYPMLMRAFRPLAGQLPHHLVIAGGKGWLYEEVLAEVGRLGLDGRVHFLGFVADDDLPALYSGAALFAFPSLYEGFGLPLLEAMACGAPVVTSNASSLPEVAGEAAVKLSPTDTAAWTEAMYTLLTHPMERARLVAAGFRQARRFTWETAARQLVEVYERLLR
ncbi:MAG: glycosyltransferase family 1 protein [Chloroflexota bacterium]